MLFNWKRKRDTLNETLLPDCVKFRKLSETTRDPAPAPAPLPRKLFPSSCIINFGYIKLDLDVPNNYSGFKITLSKTVFGFSLTMSKNGISKEYKRHSKTVTTSIISGICLDRILLSHILPKLTSEDKFKLRFPTAIYLYFLENFDENVYFIKFGGKIK